MKSTKKQIKTYRLTVKVSAKDSSKLPDWGLGKGVLGIQEVDIDQRNSEDGQFRQLHDQGQLLLNSLVEVKIEQMK